METFTIGDVVYLKSGSQSMTIAHVNGTAIKAVWFSGPTATVIEHIFDASALTHTAVAVH